MPKAHFIIQPEELKILRLVVQVLFFRDPVVESYSLSCDSPVLAMALDNERILCGLLNAQV